MSKTEDLVDPGIERETRARRRCHLRSQPLGGSFCLPPVQRAEQLVLGFEVAIERAGRKIRLIQNVHDGGVLIAVALHYRQSGFEEEPQLVVGLESPRATGAWHGPEL
jgi:hypothetical protein